MYLKYSFCVVVIFVLSINWAYSNDVPAIMWNIKGNSLHLKPVSALGRDDKLFTDSLKDIFQEDSSILVFALSKLSLEDFSTDEKSNTLNSTLQNLEAFLEGQSHMFLTSIKDPLNHIHKTHCGVQEIVVDQSIDKNVLQSVSSALDRSCVVILHVTDAGIVGNKGQIEKVFRPSFEKVNKNIVGVFTAQKSSWGVLDNEHHIFRNLLAVEKTDSNFINVTGCIIMYAENATLQIGNDTVKLPFPVDTKGSECGNSSILQLNFEPSGDVSSVVVVLTFSLKGGSWVTSGTIDITGGKGPQGELLLFTSQLEAPAGFSYSCGKLSLKANATESVYISVDRFQVQPFTTNNKFSDSFDCVPFFSIPIWMGVFVSVLFITIMNCGIYALFSVHT
ncbi:hypothetical protein X975_22847, partial [Stegodyphus mimosarum]